MSRDLSLELQNISLTVDKQSYLKDITLKLNSGAFNVLLGRTLAGKTSLMRVIAGLEKPTAGKLRLNGKDITRLAVQKRNVSMVYQQFINYPHMTVWENIASPLRLAKVAADEITRRVNHTAELLQIGEFLSRLPLELSGGQQQRCAMARALVKDAQIILFDEPLVNLDYKLRESLRHELKSIFRQRDSIAIYATTEAHEALALGGTTCLMHEGSVLQHGEALTQFYQPNTIDAADLYHEPPMNRFETHLNNGELSVAQSRTDIKCLRFSNIKNADYMFAVRPDKISLQSTHAHELVFKAKVDLAEISASETFLHVSLIEKGFEHIKWVVHLTGIHNVHYDSTIDLFIGSHDLYVFEKSGLCISSPVSPQHTLAKAAS